MKRDMRLIKAILKHIEANGTAAGIAMPVLNGYTPTEVEYHVELCGQAGFFSFEDEAGIGHPGHIYRVTRLTWAGHEQLDKLRPSS